MKKFLFGFIFAAGLVVGGALWAWNTWLPTAEQIRGCIVTQMFEVALCPGSKDYVPLNKISTHLQKTVVLTEDSSFFQHHGFDWQSIEKNAREGWESGLFKKGGSTISQQLAKNMFLSKDRTFIRKGREALITYRLEQTLTKKEILERYLNVIEFGKDLYGVKAASQFYFQKSPSDLSVMESAFLAMLLPNPKKYSSSFHKKQLTDFARKRMDQIIDNMFQYKRIDELEYMTAKHDLQRFLSPLIDELQSEEGFTPSPDDISPEEEDTFF